MIQEQRILQNFIHLTGIDSESFHERGVADALKTTLRTLGLKVSEDDADKTGGWKSKNSAGNVLGVLEGNREGEPILFSSHMDTVKPGVGKHPIVGASGKITSDGTTVLGADDIAGVAAILEALTVIREENLSHPRIEVLFPVAEELYGKGSALFDYGKIQAKTAYCLDLTEEIGTAAIAAPTILSVNIAVKGRSAHAGFNPEDGINALTAAANALSKLPTGYVAGDTTVNFGTISGGSITNAVPGLVTIGGEVRSMRHEEAQRRAETIRKVFEEEAAKIGAKAEITVTEEVHAYEMQPDESVVTRFVSAVEEAGLGEAKLTTTFGGSDNNHFAKHGLRGIVLSCAMHDVHSVHEYTDLHEMAKCAEIVLRLMTGAL